ncbi:MAG: SpoIIAA family protein [Planctomycetota bacterium]|jgi:tRNA U38,U39,U40 pseudouridine synthase TruA
MIQHEYLPEPGVLVVRPAEKLTEDDFNALAAAVDPIIEERGGLQGLLIEAEKFPGWEDFAGFTSHIRFVKDHHRAIKKVAAVTDGGILAFMPKVATHFVAAEVRHFDSAERETALAWLAE